MKICFLLITSMLFVNLAAEPEWKKRKDKAGITIYTRAIEGAPMDEFKGLVTLSNTTTIEVLNIISDIKNYPKWMPDCIEAEILVQKEDYHSIHYIAVKAPWPVTNRDAVYEMTTNLNNNNTFARIDLKPRGTYLEEKKQFVRLYKGNGFWELEETEDNKVNVTYQFLGDPGGKVPAWLANSYVVTNPYQTLKNLKNLVKR